MSNTTDSNAKETIITTSCGYDCGGRCLLKVHLRGHKVHHISTEKHQGMDIRACPRGLAQNAVVNDPQRLMQPMRRTGPRGAGQFEPISWDEALQTVAAELQRVKAQNGTESIFFVSNSGSISTLHNTPRVTQRFFSGLGSCTSTWGVTSFQAASQSSRATFGTTFTDSTRDNLLFSKLIILWGWNPVVTRFGPDTAAYLAKAKNGGAKIICVDPRNNLSSQALADQWISIKPGTDTAMLIAMAHVIITEGLHDADYIEKFTTGFNRFKAYVTG
ncbi:MAG: molybdopterin-dependent oxidoreductase, partial [Deltaproteobacteria bacterium]|nr:molybdopterin-dependent oxidoreductase [Deltaproteobacteria bacterium]